MSLQTSFFKDALIYTLPGLLSRGIGILLLPLYTRLLSPMEYGVFDLVLAVSVLANVTIAMEISQGLARYYADQANNARQKSYVSSALWFTCGAYIIFGLICLPFSTPLSTLIFGRDDMAHIFKIGLLYFFVQALFSFFQGQFRWEHKSKHYAKASMIVAVLSILTVALFGGVLNGGLIGILIALTISHTAGLLYGAIFLRHNIAPLLDKTALKDMLLFSLPLVPSGVFVFLNYYADRFLIRHFRGLEDIGLYGVAFRIAGIVGLVLIGVQTAMTPLIFKHYKEPQTPLQIADLFRLIIGCTVLLSGILAIAGDKLLFVFSTPAYFSAHTLIFPLALSLVCTNLYIFMPGTSIAKKTWLIPFFSAAGALINIGLNILLIPLLGTMGAALATLAGNAGVFLCYTISSQRFYPAPHKWLHLGGGALICLSYSTLIHNYNMSGLYGWLSDGLAIIILTILLFACRLLHIADIEHVYQKIVKTLPRGK